MDSILLQITVLSQEANPPSLEIFLMPVFKLNCPEIIIFEGSRKNIMR